MGVETMSNFKMGLLMAVSIPAILLSGCMPGEKAPIEPDKEPTQSVSIEKKAENKELVMADVIGMFEDSKDLTYYTDKMKDLGYDKPYKKILLAQGEGETKEGLIYEVADGFAMIEYEVNLDYVVAITGYQEEQEFILQEMKTKAYSLENEMGLEKDPAKRAALEKEIDALWTEISEQEL